jgi:hypothetical protein
MQYIKRLPGIMRADELPLRLHTAHVASTQSYPSECRSIPEIFFFQIVGDTMLQFLC